MGFFDGTFDNSSVQVSSKLTRTEELKEHKIRDLKQYL